MYDTSENCDAVLVREYYGTFVVASTFSTEPLLDPVHRYTFTRLGAVKSAEIAVRGGKWEPVPSFTTLPKEEVDLARRVWQRSFGCGP